MDSTVALSKVDWAEQGSTPTAPIQAGILTVLVPDGQTVREPLFLGLNIIGRQSPHVERNTQTLSRWEAEYATSSPHVHGIFLPHEAVSSTHAAIYLEGGGEFCFVKDLDSHNKTYLMGPKGAQSQLHVNDRYAVTSGAHLRFGLLTCTVEFETPAEPAATQAYFSLPEGATILEVGGAAGKLQGPDGVEDQPVVCLPTGAATPQAFNVQESAGTAPGMEQPSTSTHTTAAPSNPNTPAAATLPAAPSPTTANAAPQTEGLNTQLPFSRPSVQGDPTQPSSGGAIPSGSDRLTDGQLPASMPASELTFRAMLPDSAVAVGRSASQHGTAAVIVPGSDDDDEDDITEVMDGSDMAPQSGAERGQAAQSAHQGGGPLNGGQQQQDAAMQQEEQEGGQPTDVEDSEEIEPTEPDWVGAGSVPRVAYLAHADDNPSSGPPFTSLGLDDGDSVWDPSDSGEVRGDGEESNGDPPSPLNGSQLPTQVTPEEDAHPPVHTSPVTSSRLGLTQEGAAEAPVMPQPPMGGSNRITAVPQLDAPAVESAGEGAAGNPTGGGPHSQLSAGAHHRPIDAAPTGIFAVEGNLPCGVHAQALSGGMQGGDGGMEGSAHAAIQPEHTAAAAQVASPMPAVLISNVESRDPYAFPDTEMQPEASALFGHLNRITPPQPQNPEEGPTEESAPAGAASEGAMQQERIPAREAAEEAAGVEDTVEDPDATQQSSDDEEQASAPVTGTPSPKSTENAAASGQSKRAAIVEESPMEASRAVGGPVDAFDVGPSAVAPGNRPGPQHLDDSASPTDLEPSSQLLGSFGAAEQVLGATQNASAAMEAAGAFASIFPTQSYHESLPHTTRAQAPAPEAVGALTGPASPSATPYYDAEPAGNMDSEIADSEGFDVEPSPDMAPELEVKAAVVRRTSGRPASSHPSASPGQKFPAAAAAVGRRALEALASSPLSPARPSKSKVRTKAAKLETADKRSVGKGKRSATEAANSVHSSIATTTTAVGRVKRLSSAELRKVAGARAEIGDGVAAEKPGKGGAAKAAAKKPTLAAREGPTGSLNRRTIAGRRGTADRSATTTPAAAAPISSRKRRSTRAASEPPTGPDEVPIVPSVKEVAKKPGQSARKSIGRHTPTGSEPAAAEDLVEGTAARSSGPKSGRGRTRKSNPQSEIEAAAGEEPRVSKKCRVPLPEAAAPDPPSTTGAPLQRRTTGRSTSKPALRSGDTSAEAGLPAAEPGVETTRIGRQSRRSVSASSAVPTGPASRMDTPKGTRNKLGAAAAVATASASGKSGVQSRFGSPALAGSSPIARHAATRRSSDAVKGGLVTPTAAVQQGGKTPSRSGSEQAVRTPEVGVTPARGLRSAGPGKRAGGELQVPVPVDSPAESARERGSTRRSSKRDPPLVHSPTEGEPGTLTGVRSGKKSRFAAEQSAAGVRVHFSTSISDVLRVQLTKKVEHLGGAVLDGPESSTHFVTLAPVKGDPKTGFRKSIASLLALAAGRPILTTEWVGASSTAGAWVPPRPHLLKDLAAEKLFSFRLEAAYDRAQQKLLLAGVDTFLTPGLVAAEKDEGRGLKALLSAAGARVQTTLPKGKVASEACNWLILGNEGSIAAEVAWLRSKVGKGASFIGRTAFIQAILTQRLHSSVDPLMKP